MFGSSALGSQSPAVFDQGSVTSQEGFLQWCTLLCSRWHDLQGIPEFCLVIHALGLAISSILHPSLH